MAAEDDFDDLPVAPPAAPLLERAAAPWLEPVRRRLAEAQDQSRLPHGLLLTGPAGAGQPELAAWLGWRVLCRAQPVERPCGRCADCRLFLASNHPDYRWVSPLKDKKAIGIDQVRALSSALAMRSYRGGAKLTVITPAESMNLHAANALLKTLEEPAAETYLVLAASRIDRLPKTLLSRSQRLRLPLPAQDAALAWLAERRLKGDLASLLKLAGGSPFLAADYAAADMGEIDSEMQQAIAAAVAGRLDVVGFADRCARHAPAARLEWLESWLTRSLMEAAVGSDLVNNNRLPWLRPPGVEPKIRAGHGLLEQLRDARRQVGGPLNMQLLFEGLSVSLAALTGPRARPSGERTD